MTSWGGRCAEMRMNAEREVMSSERKREKERKREREKERKREREKENIRLLPTVDEGSRGPCCRETTQKTTCTN